MSRAAAGAAQKQLGTSNALGAAANSNASNIYSSLEPQLQQEATNPQGYAPQDLSNMRTGARQAGGGATAGITGQENLNVARTRNSAGYNGVLDQAARTGQQTASEDELGVDAANANLKQKQQQSALSSLGNLYGTNVGAGESYYGMAPSEINAWTGAQNTGWVQQLGGFLGDLGKAGQGAGSVMTGMNS
jgi:hypothetical protein